jgi:deoxyribose-phosphate aldolase
VVNYPSGDEDIGDVVQMTRQAIDDGADEIDAVFPYRAVLAGDELHAVAMIENVRRAASRPVLLKVILETGELPDDRTIAHCARLAIAAGADFIKTSTGKTKTSATLGAVEAMLAVIGETARQVGIKPSGGIKSLDDAAGYLAVADRIMGPEWVSPSTFRFGASGLLSGILDELS